MQEHVIPITNGLGTKELIDGNYTVTATVAGYDKEKKAAYVEYANGERKYAE